MILVLTFTKIVKNFFPLRLRKFNILNTSLMSNGSDKNITLF